MTTTIHRQIGRMGKRSADDASVAMLMKEVDDADMLLTKLIEHTKTWRDAWSDILINQVNLADSFHEVYKVIPMPGDSEITPVETPISILRRVAKLHATQNDLRADMIEEVEKVDRMLIERLSEVKTALKPIKKSIERREHKKLDYERFNKQVENSRAKKNKSDRDYSVLSKSEMDLERSKNAYEDADSHLKSWVPDLLSKIFEFLPSIAEFLVQTQYTLLQNTYSAIYEYAQNHDFTDPEGEIVISEWEDIFLPVQQQLESEITFVARGRAVTLPMNVIVQDKPFIPRIGRGNKPPPPPPPAHPPGARSPSGGRSPSGRRSPSGGRSPRSQGGGRSPVGERTPRIGSKFSRDRDEPPAAPPSRPSIRSRTSASNLSVHSHGSRTRARDESPPPPLPGPRPGANDPRRAMSTDENRLPEDYRSIVKSRSYGSATPLAGVAQKHGLQGVAEAHAAGYLAPSQRGDSARRRSSGGSELDDRLAAVRAKSVGGGGGGGGGGGELDDRLMAIRKNRANIEHTLAHTASASSSLGSSGAPRSPVSRNTTGASTASYRSAMSTVSAVSAGANGANMLAGIAGKKKPPPPPPKKKIGERKETWVRALFTFEGQDGGDLSFREGERILVVKMTESTDDWWEGELNGRKGQFPANYTEIVT